MKVYELTIIEDGHKRDEQYIEFANECEEAVYFAEVDGEWEHAFWFTKGEGDTFSQNDLDCWLDRMVSDLPTHAHNAIYDTIIGNDYNLKPYWMENGDELHLDLTDCKLTLRCLFVGKPSELPNAYRFDKERSLNEV